MDLEFIRRATKVTSFNLTASDFTTTRYKNEIKHIFETHLVPELGDIDYSNSVDVSLNSKIAVLRQSPNFINLYNYKKIEGVGPGEVMLFLLIQDARLGGAGSAGKDLIVGSTGYEIKAASISGDKKYATQVFTGGTVKEIPFIITEMQKLAKIMNITISGSEISPNTLKAMKERAPDQYIAIEKQYGIAVGKYFAGHSTIFMNNAGGRQFFGSIAAIKEVKPSDIAIYQITRGNIKPRVNINA